MKNPSPGGTMTPRTICARSILAEGATSAEGTTWITRTGSAKPLSCT